MLTLVILMTALSIGLMVYGTVTFVVRLRAVRRRNRIRAAQRAAIEARILDESAERPEFVRVARRPDEPSGR